MSTPTPAPALPPKHRVLVIDDEEIVLVGLRESLRRAGYDVVTGSNALAGLDALRTGPFAVVITDQQMPWMTGLEFLAQVKDVQPNASRILITAVLSLETVVEAINKGEIYRFIIKPWLREELLATVTNAVQRYELVCRHADLQETTLKLNQQLTELNRSLEEQAAKLEQQNLQLAQQNTALSLNLQRSVQICAHVMQTFCPSLGTQARRVSELCRGMAEALDLSPDERLVLEVSSRFYDLGLVGIPQEILDRWEKDPTRLNETERLLIAQHPVLGEELVRFGEPLELVGSVIRSHHERYDGGGYPDKLAGHHIPWLSRLLAVAITYVQGSRNGGDIVERITAESGAAIDPDAVRALLRVLSKARLPKKQREVLLSELKPGMVLAQGIYTANGLLLVAEDQPLSAPAIENLVHHNRLNPITQSLLVYG